VGWLRIFPIAGSGFWKVIKGSINQSSIYGNMILLAALFPFVRSYESFRRASFLGLGTCCVTLAGFLAIYIMVFDYPEIVNIAYPYQQLTRMASIGEIITHIEALYLGMWVLSANIHFALSLYISAYFFSRALQLEKFEPLLLPFAGLALLLGMQEDNIFHVTKFREILIVYSSWLLISLPICLWMADWCRGRLKK